MRERGIGEEKRDKGKEGKERKGRGCEESYGSERGVGQGE